MNDSVNLQYVQAHLEGVDEVGHVLRPGCKQAHKGVTAEGKGRQADDSVAGMAAGDTHSGKGKASSCGSMQQTMTD
jgi:hypothetical protein